VGGVISGEFLLLMPCPVGVEVAVGDDGSQLEDGFGSGQTPPCARYVHSVLDEVAAGTLYQAGGDRPAPLQGGGVVEVGTFAGEVADRLVGALAFGAGEAAGAGLIVDRGGGIDGAAGQDGTGTVGDPGLGVREVNSKASA
jgi:hypothetical protein